MTSGEPGAASRAPPKQPAERKGHSLLRLFHCTFTMDAGNLSSDVRDGQGSSTSAWERLIGLTASKTSWERRTCDSGLPSSVAVLREPCAYADARRGGGPSAVFSIAWRRPACPSLQTLVAGLFDDHAQAFAETRAVHAGQEPELSSRFSCPSRSTPHRLPRPGQGRGGARSRLRMLALFQPPARTALEECMRCPRGRGAWVRVAERLGGRGHPAADHRLTGRGGAELRGPEQRLRRLHLPAALCTVHQR